MKGDFVMREFDFTDKWLFGANFIPSNAVNQLEMWQNESFSINLIKRELGFARGIGMNVMRVFLHDLLWENDRMGLLAKMDTYLSVSDSLGIKTVFVFFDDCWNDKFSLGKQPEPIPFTHNSGWLKSPGTKAADAPGERPRLEGYVKGVMSHFSGDKRIVAWDLYNEPGNGVGDHITKVGLRENASFPLLRDVFGWAKEVSPTQPYTVGYWSDSEAGAGMQDFILDNSDIISFHFYEKKEPMQSLITELKKRADGRPIICTEYMARHMGSTFADILPLLKKNGVGAINWGLVSGKTQTVYPWDSYQEPDRYKMPFHDVFSPDGSLLVPEETDVFKKCLFNT